MARPTLSICIPTYGRSHLLIDSLRELDAPGALPFAFEVIVVDDASPDDDYAAVAGFQPRHYRLDFRRLARNLGVFPNLLGTLRRATGEFCVYLADDDRLVPDALAATVTAMQGEPDVVATYASWQELDRVTRTITNPGVRPGDGLFNRHSAAGLARTLLDNRLLPEHAVYRTSALSRALFPSDVYFWGFLLIERLLRFGAVRMSNMVFYSAVGRHPNDAYPRVTAGQGLGFQHWEAIGRGFELVAARFPAPGSAPPPDHTFHHPREQAFLAARVNQRWLEGFDVGLLLQARPGIGHLVSAAELPVQFFCAMLDAVHQAVRLMPELTGLAIHGANEQARSEIAAVIAPLRGAANFPIVLDAGDPAHAVLTMGDADRDGLIAAGRRPGAVFSLESLARVFQF